MLERAFECARHRAARPLSDAEALAAVARVALAAHDADTELAVERDAPFARSFGETATHLGSSSDPAARLHGIIHRRRGWTFDELGHESGLSVPELQHHLLLLELDGRIRRTAGRVDRVD